MIKVVMKYLKVGGCIINIVFIVVYKGNEILIDYLMIKGVIVVFIRLLFMVFLKGKIGIWVNVVVLGLIWILFIFVSFKG